MLTLVAETCSGLRVNICAEPSRAGVNMPTDRKRLNSLADLVKVLAQQGPGLGGGQVAEFGHEVHLPLGEHAGRGPQLPLPLGDGFVLVLDGGVQSFDGLVELKQRPLLLRKRRDKVSA